MRKKKLCQKNYVHKKLCAQKSNAQKKLCAKKIMVKKSYVHKKVMRQLLVREYFFNLQLLSLIVNSCRVGGIC